MAKQSIAFRVDASNQIGTGHIMRCLTLADGLRKHNAQARFVSRHMPDYLQEMLASKGYEFVLLREAHNDEKLDELMHASWLGVSQSRDAADTIRALEDQSWDWMVVDHYALDVRWEAKLRKSAKHILVIDDIADRQHDCDVLLDQNLYSDMGYRYTGKVPVHCHLLIGPQYALLREEFRKLHGQVTPRRDNNFNVIVFLGGVDSNNFTGHVIEALSKVKNPGLHVDVVIGLQHPCREEIEITCKRNNFNCHVQTEKMAELMAKADLAIGAGGSSSWERCCLGLPALLVALADNQINIARELDSYGACIYIGKAEKVSTSIIQHSIESLITSEGKLKALSEKAYSLVDGSGVDRVCQLMNS